MEPAVQPSHSSYFVFLYTNVVCCASVGQAVHAGCDDDDDDDVDDDYDDACA